MESYQAGKQAVSSGSSTRAASARARAMNSTGLELSILKLASPRRRSIHSARFTFENDAAQLYGTSNNNASSYGSSPPSPPWGGSSRMIVDDDLFTIFEQHRAAIPFKWEEFPGTPRDDFAAAVGAAAAAIAGGEGLKEGVSGSEQEDSSASSASATVSRSSSSGLSSSVSPGEEEVVVAQDPPTPKFHFKPIPSSVPITASAKKNDVSGSKQHADEIVSRTQILPLKPPPGMHSIKQLLTFENDDRRNKTFSSRSANSVISSSSIINSPRTAHRRSFRRDGLKALPFLSSSPRKDHNEEFLMTMLGFEEWPKVVQQQTKQEKKQQQQTKQEKQLQQQHMEDDAEQHRRVTSMSRLSFSFRKKPTTEKESGSIDFLDADAIFSEDFGKKGGLRERRPLTSMSSRGLADGYSNFKNRSWVYDSDTDYSDCETDARTEYFDTSHVIAEEDEKDVLQNSSEKGPSDSSCHSEAPKEKRKKYVRNPFSRVFGSSLGSRDRGHPKPSRLSSVSPAPPPTLAPTQSEPRLKTNSNQHHASSTTTTNPLLKMCLSSSIGQALLKNVRQLRSFEFHTPRSLTAK